jgi:hypothetical protein
MFLGYEKTLPLTRQVLVEKIKNNDDGFFIYTVPVGKSKNQIRHQLYQRKIGNGKAYLEGLKPLFIEENATRYSPTEIIGFRLLCFLRKIKQFRPTYLFVYDVKYFSSNAYVRAFIIKQLIANDVTIIDRNGIYKVESDIVKSIPGIINFLLDYDAYQCLTKDTPNGIPPIIGKIDY